MIDFFLLFFWINLKYSGIPELGIDHFEPLILQSVSVSRGSGSLTLAGGFKNLIVKGPSNATVSRARSVEHKWFEIKIWRPKCSHFQFCLFAIFLVLT